MPHLLLDVPVLRQEYAYSCWHTAAEMVWRHAQGRTGRQGPMNTLGDRLELAEYINLPVTQLITLAKTTGMFRLPTKGYHSEEDLHRYLDKYGPVWCAGLWQGSGHAIVLTGISGSSIYYNDPLYDDKKTGTVKWFNEKLLSGLDGCLMVKNPKSY